MSLSVHVDNKEKETLILGEGPTRGLDDTTLTTEVKYRINFTQSRKRFVLNLHYNGSNAFLFVNATKTYQFKAKTSEMKDYTLCLGNISKGLKGVVKFFSIDFNLIDTNDILGSHKYLMKRTYLLYY